MENVEIARKLDHIAALLELRDANPFRIRAYQNAARTIEGYGEPVRKMVDAGEDLTRLSNIGKDMATYIKELVHTGRLEVLEELEREVPLGLLEVMRLEGVGGKKAAKLWHELGITSLADLENAARHGKVAQLKGFGKKTEQQLLDRIRDYQARERRFLLSEADAMVEALLAHMCEAPGVDQLEVAGSWRRRKETVGDLDVLVTTRRDPHRVMEHITGWDRVARVVQAGETRTTVVLSSDMQVDVRVLPPRSFGAALCYFTGSKAHNIKVRKRALQYDLHLSEYGVFRTEKGKPSEGQWIAGYTEEEVYDCMGLPWIPPELREDAGELERAERGALPALLELKDIRGDLHMHTRWSDGSTSIERMVNACRERGYEYVAIADHSRNNGGLDGAALRKQWKELDKVAHEYDDIRILRGLEIDILDDGSLDIDDDTLEALDFAIVSVHSRFDLPSREQTRRILNAIRHPHVQALGHPTARLIGERAPIEVELDDVLKCAADHGVAMELDSRPARLDLRDAHLARACELGVKIVIDGDAHDPEGLGAIRYGVDQARRAGLEKGNVLNTLAPSRFLRALRE